MGNNGGVKCDGCGEDFDYSLGSGMRGSVTHCWDCGAQGFEFYSFLGTDSANDSAEPDCKCSCGSSSEAPVRCPNCLKPFTIEELDGMDQWFIGRWD